MNNAMQMFMMLLSGNAEQMINSNPQFKAILNQAQQSGSVKDYVLQYAKQNGVDVTEFLNFAKQRGLKF